MAPGHMHTVVLLPATIGQFQISLLVLGGLLVLGALVSGIARRSFLSLTALFVLTGFVLGPGVLDVLHLNARSGFVRDLAIVALIVILFRDGLEVDGELLQTQWHLPLRKLVLAMPLTAAIIAVGTHVLTGLNWTESFLVGALLSPTDPVLSSSVVTNPRIPAFVRQSLNLESGLNDGLALPAVLALSAALRIGGGEFVWWRFVLEDLTIGLAIGLAVGFVAAVLMPRSGRGAGGRGGVGGTGGMGSGAGIPDHQRALYALGVAFAAYGVTSLTPQGNGLIAVYVAAITLGIRREDLREHFAERSDELVEIVKLGIFVVFGSLLTLDGLFSDSWAAVGVVIVTLLVARPVAIFVALAGTKLENGTKAFMAWFGPKGVATMTFSLLVFSDQIVQRERIFELAALVVFCSIIVHGLTDTPGAEWMARRAERRA